MSTKQQSKEDKELEEYYKIEIDLLSPKRHQILFMVFITFYCIFFGLYYATEDVNIVTIAQLPFACLVYFGCYALINIGYHMIVLEDCKDAQDELLREIEMARKDLRSKGMKL